MHKSVLTRLRLGFLLLGALLLLPLFFVLRQAEARLEEQRRLRHEIVAERIFDEMQRELGALLEAERSRPSNAYDAESTRVSSWAPFVVGYFKRSEGGPELLAREQLAPARARRVQHALAAVWGQGRAPAAAEPEPLDEAIEKTQTLKPSTEPKQEDVLRQLNRAGKSRKHAKSAGTSSKGTPGQRAPADAERSTEHNDPLMGL